MTDKSDAALPSDNESFAELKRLVIARTGHFYYADKDELLWERVQRRMRALQISTIGTYRARLSDAAAANPEWTALEAEITVGETFFFRYPDQFAGLRDNVLPAILKQNRETRRIRVWSAGCASGAEPYSVAILLHELLGSALTDWRVSIIGTDINIRAIAAARAAHFNAWALRGMTASDRERYFTPGAKGMWVLRTPYRALVSFQQQNLLGMLDGSLPPQFTEFDLILCRNVLIYFHPEMMARLWRAFAERLKPRCWLFLGHAEAAFVADTMLEPVPLPGTLVYRRSDERAAEIPPTWTPPAETPPAAPVSTTAPWAPLPPPVLPPVLPRASAAHAALPPDAPQAGIVERIRGLADMGDLKSALRLCREAISRTPLFPRLYFYEGILARAQGETAVAEEAFRRAVYLDKHYAIAHYHLGLTLSDSGRAEAGRRAFANALRLAEDVPQTTLLEDGDGMSAGALQILAQQHLAHRLAAGTT